MGRNRSKYYRDPGENAGYLWRETALKCPKCGGACKALVTTKLGNARGIECTECPWSQYPGNAPPLSSTETSRQAAAERDTRKNP